MFVKKNISVTLAPFLMQRPKEVWGDDAGEFKPERWLADTTAAAETEPSQDDDDDPSPHAHLKNLTHVSNPYAFTPFNAGPRICLGQSFALSECAYTIVRLLQTFEGFELDSAKQPLPKMSSSQHKFEREDVERCWPRASLTLYVEVRI